MGTDLTIKDIKECQVKAKFHLPCVSPSFRHRSLGTWKLHGGGSRFRESKGKATTQLADNTYKLPGRKVSFPCEHGWEDPALAFERSRNSLHSLWARWHWLLPATWKFWFCKKFVLFSLNLWVSNLPSSKPVTSTPFNLSCYIFKNVSLFKVLKFKQ